MLSTFQAQVEVRQEIAPNIHRLVLKIANPPISFTAGQYLMLECKGAIRMYSLSSSPLETTRVETIIDTSPMGLGSHYVLSLKTGDEVSFRAPAGQFVLKDTQLPKVFCATGTGITPFLSMIRYLHSTGFQYPFMLLWGLKAHTDIYCLEELSSLQSQNPNFTFKIFLSRDTTHGEHFIQGHVQDGLKNPSEKSEYYVCGRPSFVESLKTLPNVHFERYT